MINTKTILNWRQVWANGQCPECDRQFQGANGVRIHLGASHRRNSPSSERREATMNSTHSQDSIAGSADPNSRADSSQIKAIQESFPNLQQNSYSPQNEVLTTSNTSQPTVSQSTTLPKSLYQPLSGSRMVLGTKATNLDWRNNWANGVCPNCQLKFKGAQGVRVHISNAHPQDSQEIKLSNKELRASQKQLKKCGPRADLNTLHHPPGHLNRNNPLSQLEQHADNITKDHSLNTNTPSVEPWLTVFSQLLNRNAEDNISEEFDVHVQNFSEFLVQSLQHLPGPKHPNTKFYEARRKGRNRKVQSNYNNSSNPMRKDKRKKAKIREQYQHDLAQFHYHNVRKRAVNAILNPKGKGSCQIQVSEVEDHFRGVLESPNNLVREDYQTTPVLSPTDSPPQENEITGGEIAEVIKGMAADTSPGPDRVLLRVVKSLKCERVIALIATIMYRRTLVPKSFRNGRMVLIEKDGDPKLIKNWRPITIFSVLRRIIERVLDRRLRSKVQFCTSQHGFVNVPGTHLNSSIVNGVLRQAKSKSRDCVIVFLDISKAFDNIGHAHIKNTLSSLPLPSELRDLLLALCTDNSVQVSVGHQQTPPIRVLRGVPQGGPLSPALFNLCIDFLLKEIGDNAVAGDYGFPLVEGLSPLAILAFADDLAILARDEESADRLIGMVSRALQSIGLEINTAKSEAIVLRKGHLHHSTFGFPIDTEHSIRTLQRGERVRYLGIDYEEEIILDDVKILRDLKTKVDLLTNSPLLYPDQKLNILNMFIWPALVYPLQCAPLDKIKSGFLEDVDKLIRGSVKQICGLPMDTPNSMLYSHCKFRGLGVIRASWEAYLQQINIAQRLHKIQDQYLTSCRDLQNEVVACLTKLDLPPQQDVNTSEYSIDNHVSTKTLRLELRDREFSKWCELPTKGKGVCIFREFPATNKWIMERQGMSMSEWTNALKMSTNGCNLRSNPRTASSTIHCRHCGEFESLAHVLGSCPRGELLRNRRHQKVCDTIKDDLLLKGYRVSREDRVATDDGLRFSDLVVINPDSREGYVLDPTIRFEKSVDQALEVDREKKNTYEPTLEIYRQRHPEVPVWQVIGLLFGARGSLPTFTVNVLQGIFGLPKALLVKMTLDVMKDSIGILHHHIYTRTNN